MGALGQQLNERVSSNCAMRCRAAAPLPPPRRRGDACWMLQEALTCRTHDTSARTIAGAFSSLTEFLQLDFPSRNSVISRGKKRKEEVHFLSILSLTLCWTVSMSKVVRPSPPRPRTARPRTRPTTNDPPNEPVIKKKPLLLSNRLSNQPLRQGQAAGTQPTVR